MRTQRRDYLPYGFKIDPSFCFDRGTGYGDDRYCSALYERRPVTRRRFFFRPRTTTWEWVLVNYMPHTCHDIATKEFIRDAWLIREERGT